MAVQSPPAEPSEPRPSRGLSRSPLLVLVVIVVVAGGAALVTMGGDGAHPSAGSIHGVASSRFSGSLASPQKLEPPLALHNDKGEAVDIAQYRGKAVLVTFLYTNCPDVCPIIASNLRVAQNLMGSAETSKVAIIAVSVDPRGDTSKAVAAFLARHEMTGRMQYLIGSAHQLARVWKAWYVGSEREVQQPQLVNHSGLIYGVSASGKITTLYAANVSPKEIAHDVPLLASS